MAGQILLIGDLGSGGSSIAKHAKGANMQVSVVDSVDQAIDLLCVKQVDMAFLSAGTDLSSFFGRYNESRLNTPVVTVGDSSNVQKAVSAIRMGAIEYLTTPLEDKAVKELLEKFSNRGDGPVHGDAKTAKLLELARKFAASQASVLLRGESGTGKEVLSQFIHNNSPRKDKPFISVNCAAIPENLLESELFGHEKGAFSGALQKRLGKFQQADGGTLLLDEISEMDLALQAKLLRAIQERVIDPVGSSSPVPVDIRLIATTNRDMEKEVQEGRFREDLYFRLNVVTLEIPPLRERAGDIMPLAQYFADKYGKLYDMNDLHFSKVAKEKLEGCYWKGNVRELENTIHRALLLTTGDEIDADNIEISAMSRNMGMGGGAAPAASKPAVSAGAANAYAAANKNFEGGGISKPFVGRTMQDMEKEHILSTLDYCGGNRDHAANILGITLHALRNKLKEFEASGELALPPETEEAAAR